MPSPKDSPNRNQTFGRLLSGAINSIATYEGKTAPTVEEELGALAIVAGKTIQRYKAGHLPPEHETVKVLADAAIRRGFLGREWLQRFLHAARYPFADTLLDQLCPVGPARPRPPRVYENLPAPTYSRFVVREQAFAEVIDGLSKRSAAVLIVGLGGNGKTSLAREIAGACLKGSYGAPQFDAAVWISDKDRSGTTNLSVVLDEIARTLDYPGFAQFEHAEKRREVEQLLKRQRVLVVVDNFETISDGALLAWLLCLPEPSKVLVTSREYSRAFRNSTIVVDLRGMGETEALSFIDQRLQVLRIAQLVGDKTQLEPLLVATGGNPKAIEMALGIVKHEHRPLQHVVDDLYAARGDLFDDLFTRAWALLDEAAQRVLLATTFFPSSASSEALAATADVQGFAFELAVERLADLALFDVQQVDLSSTARYALHPLVQAFARARLAEQAAFEDKARERWAEWYIQLVDQIGYCWNNIEKLQRFDHEGDSAFAAAEWLNRRHQFQSAFLLAQTLDYYYYVRGLWEKTNLANALSTEAAKGLGDNAKLARTLATHIHMLCRQNNLTEITQYLHQLNEFASDAEISIDIQAEVLFVLGFYHITIRDFHLAQLYIERCLHKPVSLERRDLHLSSYRYLGFCYAQTGRLDAAQSLFGETIIQAKSDGDQRTIINCHLMLTDIDLIQDNQEQAEIQLERAAVIIRQYNIRRDTPTMHRLYARLHTRRGDVPAARASLVEAIDLFERLGMRRELAEARGELVQLDELSAAPS